MAGTTKLSPGLLTDSTPGLRSQPPTWPWEKPLAKPLVSNSTQQERSPRTSWLLTERFHHTKTNAYRHTCTSPSLFLGESLTNAVSPETKWTFPQATVCSVSPLTFSLPHLWRKVCETKQKKDKLSMFGGGQGDVTKNKMYQMRF